MQKTSGFDAPRKLTSVEIAFIAGVIPPVKAGTTDIADENLAQIRDMTSRQLAEIELRPSKIKKMREEVYNRCMRARAHAGENVGLHASESIGQPISQINLNTFHKSGAAGGGAGGINDFKRVFSLTKNPNDRTHLFMSDLGVEIIDIINISKVFVETPVTTLLKGVKILTIPPGGIDNRAVFGSYYRLFEEMMSFDENKFKALQHAKNNCMLPSTPFMRLSFDRFQLFLNRISTKDIGVNLASVVGSKAFVVFSPTKDATIDIFPCLVPPPTTAANKTGGRKSSVGGGGVGKTSSSTFDNNNIGADDEDDDAIDFGNVEGADDDEDGLMMMAEGDEEGDYEDWTGGGGEASSSVQEKATSAMIFIQEIMPIMRDPKIVVHSGTIVREIEKLSDSFDSQSFAEENGEIPLFGAHRLIQVGAIANYKSVAHGTFDVMTAFNGETEKPLANLEEKRDGFKIWNLWVNKYLMNVNGTRLRTMVRIIDIAFGGVGMYDRLNHKNIIEGGGGKEEDHIQIVLPDTIKSPLQYVRDLIKEQAPEDITKVPESKFFRPPPKPTTELAKLSRRHYIMLHESMSHTLKTLHAIPIFDRRFTFVNNFHELYNTIGIDATRTVIISEIYSLFKSVNSFVNPVHIKLTADVMTSNSMLMPISARGAAAKHLGAYYDGSFEQALQVFKKAAVWGAEETVKTASSSVLFGTRCRFGTGSFKIRPTDSVSHLYTKHPETRTATTGEVSAGDFSFDRIDDGDTESAVVASATTNKASVVVPVLSSPPPLVRDPFSDMVFPPRGGIPIKFYQRGISPLLLSSKKKGTSQQ